MERWPSGLRRTPGKCVWLIAIQGSNPCLSVYLWQDRLELTLAQKENGHLPLRTTELGGNDDHSTAAKEGLVYTEEQLRVLEQARRERETIPDEFYKTIFRKKIFGNTEDLQVELDRWLDFYNRERTHQGKRCQDKTPMATFVDGLELARKAKLNCGETDSLTITSQR